MKVLKSIKNVFYKSCKNKDLPIGERFSYPDAKSSKFLIQFKNSMKRNFFQSLIHPVETTIVTSAHYDYLKIDIIHFIKLFTMTSEKTDEVIEDLKNALLKTYKEIKNIKYKDRDSCTINLNNDKDIYFQTITSSFNNLKDYPDLTTSARDKKCHMRSLFLADRITDECYCVTGTIHNFTSRMKFLHSWVEMEHKDKLYCIDNNWNAILPKEDYYYLQNPKIIQRISQKRIDEDRNAILYLNDRAREETPYIKLYCTSPDEAIEKYNELKKQEIIKET